jgi:hypothetical protein
MFQYSAQRHFLIQVFAMAWTSSEDVLDDFEGVKCRAVSTKVRLLNQSTVESPLTRLIQYKNMFQRLPQVGILQLEAQKELGTLLRGRSHFIEMRAYSDRAVLGQGILPEEFCERQTY